MVHDKKVESFVAVGCFLAAVGLAFVSIYIRPNHDIAASVLIMGAQFLTLTATIFGLDYKISQFISRLNKEGGTK